MPNVEVESGRLRREFGYDADYLLVRSDVEFWAQGLSAATVKAFINAVQGEIDTTA